jgi:hypothetical protein
MKCELCHKKQIRVLYAGFPMWLCSNEDCNYVSGFWSFICDWIPFNGVFFAYKDNDNYLSALWKWLSQ